MQLSVVVRIAARNEWRGAGVAGYEGWLEFLMPAPRAKTILLTGFGAFPGARSNPTEVIARRLGALRRFALLGVKVEARVLPVVYDKIESELRKLLDEVKPDVVIHLGLAGRRKVVSVETRAINRVYMLRPDAARRFSATNVVVAGGGVRKSRWPGARLVKAMSAHAPVKASIDAGDYLCNQALYLTLGLCAAPAGFIHVPKPRARKPLREDYAANQAQPTLAAMTRAVEAAIVAMIPATPRA